MTRGLWLGTWGARARGEEFRENGFGVSVDGERVKRYNWTGLTIVQFDREVRFNLSGQRPAADSGASSRFKTFGITLVRLCLVIRSTST